MKTIIKFMLAIITTFSIIHPTYIYAEDDNSEEPNTTESSDSSGLTDKQRNSIAMLNYLTVLNQEINASKNSKLFLEEAYDALISNTYPTAIDNTTQIQLNYMLDTIEDYRMIDVKRERLQYIYDQNKAQALRDAVPNPMGLLSATMSFDWKKMIASVVYMAIDSKASYDTAMAKADMQYLQDNWALDDAASTALHQSRKQLFDYMIDIVQENNLPGDYTLSEKTVNEFVEYRNEKNVTIRIQSLESHKKTYEHFGGYWLLLAQSYYENGDYQKCLDAVDEYERIQTRIFRNDHDYANTLPLAIYSAKETIRNQNTLKTTIRKYVEALVQNIDTDDWSLRYFAAQTYVYLYSLTSDKNDLKEAYNLTLENVTALVKEQEKMNELYLSDVVKIEVPKDATKDEKKDINNYNKLLQEARKDELPPVYEPLYLNCDLLFALADQIGISSGEKNKIERILHGSQNSPIFLNTLLNETYSFSEKSNKNESYSFEFDKDTIVIPANLVSDTSIISMIVKSKDGSEFEANDWKVKKVDRRKSNRVEDFEVTYTSASAKKYDYKDGDVVTITIDSVPGSDIESIVVKYNTNIVKKFKVLNDITFTVVK